MQVAVSEPAPVAELDAELEGRLGATDEVVLVDAEEPVEQLDRRDGGFPDADRSDLRRLDQLDAGDRSVADPRQRGRRHPAGRAAADDGDAADRLAWHHVPAAGRASP